MRRTRTAKILVMLGVAVLGALIVWRGLHRGISSHRGDGIFHDLSSGLGPLAIRGYLIAMPQFDLGHPQQAEYRVAGLTDLGRDCGVYLHIRDHDGRWTKDASRLNGTLRLRVLDSRGQTIADANGRLGDFTWSSWMDVDGPRHGLYQLDHSFFAPDPRQEYRIRLDYEPDPQLAAQEAFVTLRSAKTK